MLWVEVVGDEGNMEQLLSKTRFEEAKWKHLAMVTQSHSQKSGEYEATPILQTATSVNGLGKLIHHEKLFQ